MGFLQRFMVGRYGRDQLNVCFLVLFVVLYLVGTFTGLGFLSIIGMAILLLSLLRMLSRNIERRRAENAKFLKLIAPVQKWIRLRRTMHQDKDHCYFKCPNCGQQLRVPRGKGKLTITCRSCGTSFQEKT